MMKATLPMMALTAWLVIGMCSALPPSPDIPYPYSEIPTPDGYSLGLDWSEYPTEYPAEYPTGPSPSPDIPFPATVPSGYDLPPVADSGYDHPASGPSISQPVSAPTVDVVQPLTYLSEGKSLSTHDVSAAGGLQAVSGLVAGSGSESYSYTSSDGMQTKAVALMFGPGTGTAFGPQLWTRYHGHWTSDPASISLGGWTNMLVKNDRWQRVWSWERYPNGSQRWSYWGLKNPGYFSGQFVGDTRGWHYLAMWGGRTGWSNVVPIFVWW